MNKAIYIILILLHFSLFNIVGQNITVTSSIDSTTMWIGSQTKLSFSISQPKGQLVGLPIFSDTIVGGLEIVEALKLDTSATDGMLNVTQSYIVTAFDDSLMYIPSYPFVSEGDTVWSKALSLKVIQPFVIDTTSNQLADIKGVYTPPIYWKGIFKIIFIILLIIGLLTGVYFIVRRYMRREKPQIAAEPEEIIPAYLLALEDLDKIKQEKPWQKGRSKEYHTQLTDVLRIYIEKNFGVSALEMTSEELLTTLNHLRFESKTAYDALKEILKLADLVKFAKWNALPTEHEQSLSDAYTFVNLTKTELPEENENTAENSTQM